MIDEGEIPESQVERAYMLENTLTAHATGGTVDAQIYALLRKEFTADPTLRELLPRFVRTCRNVGAFWAYIKREADTYAERRAIIAEAFTPLIDHLEGRYRAPGDEVTSLTLETFDIAGVHAVWDKALERRTADPEGAITVARTLVETVTKRILEEAGEPYTDKEDLPKLYGRVARVLNLAPSQHTEEPIKAILGGATNLVNGLGTLRNRLSDSHGRGGRAPVRPSVRHANLAVNTAGAVACFLVETYLARQDRAEPIAPTELGRTDGRSAGRGASGLLAPQ